jgi:nucleotide-binding universal stress UspA family protein
MIAIKKILVPTDLSECSLRAAEYAAELASHFGAEIHLIHVVEQIAVPAYYGPLPEEMLHPEKNAREALEKWGDSELGKASDVVRSIANGTPFVEIVRYAREQEMDLIVIGTHGRSGLSHALLGSVAEKVVRKANCAVLTVRPDGHQFVMP